jgi:ribonuclease HI
MNEQKGHTLFTDGSSLGNPGPGGWGAVLVLHGGRVIEMGGGEKMTTNNRMELAALIKGLDRISDEYGDLTIYLDSSYVHKGATVWSPAWQKNNWQTKAKTDVGNRDLWEQLLPLLAARKKIGKIIWKHIPGHSGIAGNERADVIATGFAAGDDVELFEGELENYTIDILNTAVNEGVAAKRSLSRAHSRAPAYSYLSLMNGKAMRHTTWADCEKRVKGRSGVKYKKALSADDEQKILREWNTRL